MIDKIITNKQKGKKYCEKILGSQARVGTAGSFYERHEDILQIIKTHGLIDYAENNDFTEKEYAAYKGGLYYFVAFMEACSKESKPQSDS